LTELIVERVRGNKKKTQSVATDCGEDVHRVESDEKKVRYNGRWHSFKLRLYTVQLRQLGSYLLFAGAARTLSSFSSPFLFPPSSQVHPGCGSVTTNHCWTSYMWCHHGRLVFFSLLQQSISLHPQAFHLSAGSPKPHGHHHPSSQILLNARTYSPFRCTFKRVCYSFLVSSHIFNWLLGCAGLCFCLSSKYVEINALSDKVLFLLQLTHAWEIS
jgi:hypothetical protein